MSEPGEVTDRVTRASPWPILIAVGLAASEVGIVLPSAPIAVVGLLVFVGAIAGILLETGYVESPSIVLGALGAVCLAGGSAVVLSTSGTIAFRGQAIALAGALLVVGGVVVRVRAPRRR